MCKVKNKYKESGSSVLIVNFKHILHFFLVFLLFVDCGEVHVYRGALSCVNISIN